MCDMSCPLYKATVENDTAKKREIFEKRGWKERFGVDFDPANVFCHGCKPVDKPLNVRELACTARKCTMERGLESCIQCNRIANCDMELWTNFPKFKKQVQKWQTEYVAAGLVKLS